MPFPEPETALAAIIDPTVKGDLIRRESADHNSPNCARRTAERGCPHMSYAMSCAKGARLRSEV